METEPEPDPLTELADWLWRNTSMTQEEIDQYFAQEYDHGE